VQWQSKSLELNAILFLGAALLFGCGRNESEPRTGDRYDYLIRGAIVVDGSGAPPFQADVAIAGDRIAAVGDLNAAQADIIIDATGKLVVPGFIDLHSHADDQQGDWRGMRSPDSQRRAAPAFVSQGITTSVTNPDGLSPNMPLAEQIASVEARPFALNLAYMSAHARIRFAVLGEDSARPATSREVALMQEVLKSDMEAGAWGLATVLEMRDGHWSTTEELIGLTSALKRFDGAFIAHPRSQSHRPGWWLPSLHAKRSTDYPWAPSMFEASKELITIAETNGIRVSISHISMRGPDPDQDVIRTIDAVNEARERGVDIYADMHVYKANEIGTFGGLMPFWAVATGKPSPTFHIRPSQPQRVFDYLTPLRDTLADPEKEERLRQDVEYLIAFRGGPYEIFITEHPNNEWIGKSLAKLADQYGLTAVDMAIKIALEGDSQYVGGSRAYGNFRSEENIALFVKNEWVAGDTDGYTTRPGDPGYMSPRFYGAYPAWLKTYVIDRELVSLEFAIRSFTGLAAEILGISDRGVIRSGLAADLSIIDLGKVAPQSTFYDFHAFSTGFDYVFINGTPVVAEAELTWALPGRVLRKPHN